MPKRSRGPKGARVNTPIDELNTKETIAHYNAVLLEEQNSKFQLVMERMDLLIVQVDKRFEAFSVQVDKRFEAFEQKIDRRFEAFRAEVDQKFEAFEQKIERRFSILEQAVRGLKDDMIDMEHRICSKINRISERCDDHECRLNALEANQ